MADVVRATRRKHRKVPPPGDTQKLTARQVSEEFPLSMSRIYDLVQGKHITHIRTDSGRLFFTRPMIREYFDTHGVTGKWTTVVKAKRPRPNRFTP